jgi:hypothetical protein
MNLDYGTLKKKAARVNSREEVLPETQKCFVKNRQEEGGDGQPFDILTKRGRG